MITYDSVTDKGERKKNEDSIGFIQKENRSVFILADGLGGHGNGYLASQFVVSYIKNCIDQNQGMEMQECICQSQNALLEKQKELNAGNSMKTTLTVLDIQQGYAKLYHVGDSRIYFFRKNKFIQRTLDHSVPQMLCQTGRIKEKDIRHHVDRSKLLRVMGTPWETPRFSVSERIELKPKDTFLLCSDGFWELIDEKQMIKLLKKSSSGGEWIEKMTQEVVKNGVGTNMDNYSAIAVINN